MFGLNKQNLLTWGGFRPFSRDILSPFSSVQKHVPVCSTTKTLEVVRGIFLEMPGIMYQVYTGYLVLFTRYARNNYQVQGIIYQEYPKLDRGDPIEP